MPETSPEPVAVHSTQEEYFHMMVNPCGCGGAWMSRDQDLDRAGDRLLHRVEATCAACGEEKTFHFALPTDAAPDRPAAVREINPTDRPSEAVDLAGWMGLAKFYLERIERLKDKVRKAQSLYDARLCLEEGLKFFGPEAEEPPREALWSEAARRKVAAHPEAYRRSAIEGMLERIPPTEWLRRIDGPVQKQFEQGLRAEAGRRARSRWKFWKRWFGKD